MNPDDVRGLFDEALAGADPAPTSDTDDIVAAGRRRVRRRRAAVGTGAAAGVAVLAAALAVPMWIGGAAPLDPAGPGDDTAACDAPDERATDDQRAVAAMYDEAIEQEVAALGGTVAGYCGEFAPDYDDFYYDPEADGYRYEELVIFRDTGEHAILRVDVLEGDGTEPMDRMTGLAGCGPEMECTQNPGLNEEGPPLLLVEGTRTVRQFGTEADSESTTRVPVRAALIEQGDGVIVRVELEEGQRSGTLGITPEQLADVAQAIPVGEETAPIEAPEADDIEAYMLPADAELVQALLDGIEERFPGAALPAAAEVEFVAQEDTEAYAEGYYYGNDGTRVAYADATVDGEQVRFFLQVTPLEAAGDGGASQAAAEHYANCARFECDYAALDDATALVHRSSVAVRPGPTAIEHRADDGWVVGVGVESLGSTEAPSIDFDDLDPIVQVVR